MTSQRDIKNRIKSAKNTCQITSTMEMVATAKMKKIQNRLGQAKAFDLKLTKIIHSLLSMEDIEYSHPLMHEADSESRVLIFEIVGNKGLCGSFNSNIMKNTIRFMDELFAKEEKESFIYSVGKKGVNHHAFEKQSCYKGILNPDIAISFDDAVNFGEELKDLFLKGEFHEIYISYSKVLSQSHQEPEIIKLLPANLIVSDGDDDSDVKISSVFSDYHFESKPDKVFAYLLPLFIKMKIYICFLETLYSEFFARRIAMKNATDASNEMVDNLTVMYNHARQIKITNEISEIIGGTAGLE